MRTESISLLAAIAFHGAAVLIAPHFIDPHALDRFVASRQIQTIDIDLSALKSVPPALPPTEVTPPPAVAPGEQAPAGEARVARALPPPGAQIPSGPVEPGTPSPDATATPGAGVGPSAPPGPGGDHYDPLAADNGSGVLTAPPGLGGAPIYTMPGMMADLPRAAPAPTEAPKPRQVDKDMGGIVVRQEMAKNDKAKGIDLPAAGTVNSAAKRAVEAAVDAPDTAKVSFVVRLGPGGKVLGVQVTGFSAGSAGVWDQVARAIQAALAGRNLELTDAYEKGALVYVDVTSAFALPSGSTSSVQHKESGISFDTSDIGARKHRQVRASFRTVAAR
ncbi:MAG: hypothetical protein U0359_21300 [Byssovorax sp.]